MKRIFNWYKKGIREERGSCMAPTGFVMLMLYLLFAFPQVPAIYRWVSFGVFCLFCLIVGVIFFTEPEK